MRGSDFLQLDPEPVGRGARTEWLTLRLRTAILDGALGIGSRLPSSRVLAEDLGFSRGTVAEAYRRLTEEGLIAGSAGAGTTVVAAGLLSARAAGRSAAASAAAPAATPAGAPAGRSDAWVEVPGASHDAVPSSLPHADVIDVATGLPDLAAFPRGAWLRAEREVLATATARQLGYAPPEGTVELRHELSGWLARSRGVVAQPDRIIVTGGVTGALSLVAQLLRDDRSVPIAVEDPCAEGSRRILRHWLGEVTPVAVDRDGIEVRRLSASGARAVLVTPAHQYPTGVVLSPERRREIVAWARDGGNLVIEDDYDAEYRYDRRPVRAVQPLAPDAVAYASSLSKTLAPALRLGWLVAPEHLHPRLVELRWAIDLGSPALPQLTLAHLLRSGALERHLRSMRVRHRARRDAALVALREHLPGCSVVGIAAGLHLVIELADGVDDERIAADARAEGVLVQPLGRHFAGVGRPGLVISYAGNHPARVQRAIEVLAHVIHRRGGTLAAS
ncbi:PLP-dependent aminotransferase family protein [Agromyces sp. Soil535]|uniref:MocR-like pyridoxine biosynthesis transcription factor PdxR n=1 Tax=Agromyces sp. Soil535 TaxID=1736390 RepID=UPI0006FF6AA1|nr:PLP-dependent aminotransferase family protein [Agromyces sp. Soil535]KRE21532.1 GntR family transcriptional regulator [Agromyces sp. Soil535]